MARVTDITFDHVAVGTLLRTPEMEAEMIRRMAAVMELAIATAPVGQPGNDPHPGRYKASFRLEHGLAGFPGAHTLNDRAWAALDNDAPEAIYVEYGTRNNQARHTMLKALIAGARD